MSGPWTFDEAAAANNQAAALQRGAEEALRKAYAEASDAENAYRRAHAAALVRERETGDPMALCEARAKADDEVCRLRRERDIAEGAKKAAEQEGWRRSADRRVAEGLLAWSMRRELAEHGQDTGGEQPAWTPRAA